jgi:hypothetical protein
MGDFGEYPPIPDTPNPYSTILRSFFGRVRIFTPPLARIAKKGFQSDLEGFLVKTRFTLVLAVCSLVFEEVWVKS